MSSGLPACVPARPATPAVATSGVALRILERLLLWVTMARSRRDLAALDERALHDIGIDRATAMEEAAKPFWRSP